MVRWLVIQVVVYGCCTWMASQQSVAAQQSIMSYKIGLSSYEQQPLQVNLNDETNNFLLTLPLNFSMVDANTLAMMVGNDANLPAGQSVWLFSEEIALNTLMRMNRNVNAGNTFKGRNAMFEKMLVASKGVKLYRPFDDGYEMIKKNVKPVFFTVVNPNSNMLELTLQLYVSKHEGNYPCFFIAKCRPVKIEINIK